MSNTMSMSVPMRARAPGVNPAAQPAPETITQLPAEVGAQ